MVIFCAYMTRQASLVAFVGLYCVWFISTDLGIDIKLTDLAKNTCTVGLKS